MAMSCTFFLLVAVDGLGLPFPVWWSTGLVGQHVFGFLFLLNALVDFIPVNWYFLGCINGEPDLVTFHGLNNHGYVISNADYFAGLAGKN
jgi:hypothetical protein